MLKTTNNSQFKEAKKGLCKNFLKQVKKFNRNKSKSEERIHSQLAKNTFPHSKNVISNQESKTSERNIRYNMLYQNNKSQRLLSNNKRMISAATLPSSNLRKN